MKKTKSKKVRVQKLSYQTVGVKFLQGTQLWKIYTYRVKKGFKLYLGQELVAPTEFGNRIVVVAVLHATPQDDGPYDYKYITHRLVPI